MKIHFSEIDPFLSLTVIYDIVKGVTRRYKMGLQIANLREKCKDNKPAFLATITKLNMDEFNAEMLEALAITFQKTHHVELLSNTEELEKNILFALLPEKFPHRKEIMLATSSQNIVELIVFISLQLAINNNHTYLEIPTPEVKISSQPLEYEIPSTPSPEDIFILNNYAVTTPNPFFKELYEAES